LVIFDNALAGTYLKAMFLVPLFMSLNQTLSGILHSIRKEVASSVITIISMVVQLISIYIFLPVPGINIYAYIYTVTIVSLFTCLLHLVVLAKALKNFKH